MNGWMWAARDDRYRGLEHHDVDKLRCKPGAKVGPVDRAQGACAWVLSLAKRLRKRLPSEAWDGRLLLEKPGGRGLLSDTSDVDCLGQCMDEDAAEEEDNPLLLGADSPLARSTIALFLVSGTPNGQGNCDPHTLCQSMEALAQEEAMREWLAFLLQSGAVTGF